MPEITKIVITGGPCAGKSTAMSWIQNFFGKQGIRVLFISETATDLITGGVAPWTCSKNVEYQEYHLKLQLLKEDIYYKAASNLKDERILIVCDRGLLDPKAYMNEFEFKQALEDLNTNEIELRDNYDAVFHLVTAAKGAAEFYTLENNAARKETLEEARELDDKLIAAWTGHPHFRVIDNSKNFEEKMKKLLSEISSIFGTSKPYEIERKFLIKYPDLDYLTSLPNCKRVQIIQTYLNLSDEGSEEIRVRKRGINGNYIYFKTTKRKISDIKRVEVEKRLTKEEYYEILGSTKDKYQVIKDRYCLCYENQYFEIDVYPFWNDKACIELELDDETLCAALLHDVVEYTNITFEELEKEFPEEVMEILHLLTHPEDED